MPVFRRTVIAMSGTAITAATLLGAACSGNAGTPSEASDLTAAVAGDWTTEGGSGPSVMGLLLTPSGPALQGRMRLSGVEDHATGSCSASQCTLYFARRGGAQSRLELRLGENGSRLHVRATTDAPSAEARDYVLVRAQAR